MQRAVIYAERAQIDPGEIGGLRRLPVQLREGVIERLSNIAHVVLQIGPQRIEPRGAFTVGGNMGDQRRYGRRREAIATLQSREISFAGCGIINQAVSPGKRGNIEAFEPEVNSAHGPRATSHHGV